MNKATYAKQTRRYRRVHRWTGVTLSFFLLTMALTGIALAWKKDCNEWIMPNTYKGSSTKITEWISLTKLETIAVNALSEYTDANESPVVSRMDVRPTKGVVKVVFVDTFWEVQIDGKSGMVLNVGKRYSDAIEAFHDLSILDIWIGTKSFFKLFLCTILGIAMVLFVFTGWRLYRAPRRQQKYVEPKL